MLDWTLTIVGLIATLGLCVVANWRAGLPWDDMHPRKVPWRGVLVFSTFVFVLLLVHLVNLLGVETGPDKSPFGRF
ncbi:MAG: hypothetical protein AAGK23_06570 [Pseudomonadota bacterium]